MAIMIERDIANCARYRIDDDGSIWRVATISRTGRTVWIVPKRCDGIDVSTGYRRVYHDGRLALAHRVVWFYVNGAIPNGMEVNHKNLNKSDNRPGNLELLTHLKNVQHATHNGRLPSSTRSGQLNGNAKLTATQVRKIRSDTRPHRSIAVDYKVSRSLVGAIKRGEKWP